MRGGRKSTKFMQPLWLEYTSTLKVSFSFPSFQLNAFTEHNLIAELPICIYSSYLSKDIVMSYVKISLLFEYKKYIFNIQITLYHAQLCQYFLFLTCKSYNSLSAELVNQRRSCLLKGYKCPYMMLEHVWSLRAFAVWLLNQKCITEVKQKVFAYGLAEGPFWPILMAHL